MDPILYDLLEPVVIFATLLGTAFGVKLLIWGKGPIRRIRRSEDDPAPAQRITELEDRVERSNDVIAHQAEQLDELNERLDFTERMLTRQRAEPPKALDGPNRETS
jgi:uncharacterized coiled-coil protein SlyX